MRRILTTGVLAILLAGGVSAVSPAASASPAAPPPLRSTDGRHLVRCADGRCEVLVHTGDLLPTATGLGRLHVVVRGGRATVFGAANGFSASATGTPGSTMQINRQVFQVVRIRSGWAVLRLRLA
jgi:hypothetical protein